MATKTKEIWEFGDFQTPNDLCVQIVSMLHRSITAPASIIEPTCGKGSLLLNAVTIYPDTQRIIGVDINLNYLKDLRARIYDDGIRCDIEIIHSDFFDTNWEALISTLPQPILLIGNPPWVTSAELSTLNSRNMPIKSNFHGRNGLDAITGKSNFDISEWMLLQHLNWFQSKSGVIAMLCKSIVARKVLLYAWKNNLKISTAKMFKIDAKYHFNAAVDACLLVMTFDGYSSSWYCDIFNEIYDTVATSQLGYQDGLIIADLISYQQIQYLFSKEENYIWRSGIKHDCSKIMELDYDANHGFINGKDDEISLEQDFLYPLLKSSDIGNERIYGRKKYMLVTQTFVGEDTSKIKKIAPKTWEYLQNNLSSFVNRGSSIYKNKPSFSIFGVGDYTFTSWKVAISGFYKKLNFLVISPIDGKPVVFDDTIYFLSCSSYEEADFLANLLNSNIATQFFKSMIFWEEKRPITAEILKRLNIRKLAHSLGVEHIYLEFVDKSRVCAEDKPTQLCMLEQNTPYS